MTFALSCWTWLLPKTSERSTKPRSSTTQELAKRCVSCAAVRLCHASSHAVRPASPCHALLCFSSLLSLLRRSGSPRSAAGAPRDLPSSDSSPLSAGGPCRKDAEEAKAAEEASGHVGSCRIAPAVTSLRRQGDKRREKKAFASVATRGCTGCDSDLPSFMRIRVVNVSL